MFWKKKLCCNHEYKFFNKSESPRWMGDYMQWKYEFICTKCQKVISITEDEIDKEMKDAERVINKMKALNQNIPYETQDMGFSVCGYPWDNGYEGEYVSLATENCKSRGFDLEQIRAQ